MSRFHHFAHLKHPPLVKAGQYVERGQLLGYVGATGAASGAHLHYEVMKGKPPSFHFYPNGWAKKAVERLYEDPRRFIRDGFPADFTYDGWGYLEFTGKVFHPGIDINSPSDDGKPVYAPVPGRVQFSEGISGWKRFGHRILPQYVNGGWGNHLWLEEDHAKSLFE